VRCCAIDGATVVAGDCCSATAPAMAGHYTLPKCMRIHAHLTLAGVLEVSVAGAAATASDVGKLLSENTHRATGPSAVSESSPGCAVRPI
jgi:hypothetical protein